MFCFVLFFSLWKFQQSDSNSFLSLAHQFLSDQIPGFSLHSVSSPVLVFLCGLFFWSIPSQTLIQTPGALWDSHSGDGAHANTMDAASSNHGNKPCVMTSSRTSLITQTKEMRETSQQDWEGLSLFRIYHLGTDTFLYEKNEFRLQGFSLGFLPFTSSSGNRPWPDSSPIFSCS